MPNQWQPGLPMHTSINTSTVIQSEERAAHGTVLDAESVRAKLDHTDKQLPMLVMQSEARAAPCIVVDAKPVTAGLAHGIPPVQVTSGGQPVVKHPLLQVPHHSLIPPHPVACSAECPAAQTGRVCFPTSSMSLQQ